MNQILRFSVLLCILFLSAAIGCEQAPTPEVLTEQPAPAASTEQTPPPAENPAPAGLTDQIGNLEPNDVQQPVVEPEARLHILFAADSLGVYSPCPT